MQKERFFISKVYIDSSKALSLSWPEAQQAAAHQQQQASPATTGDVAQCPVLVPLLLTYRARVSAAPCTMSPPSLETDTERQLLPDSR